MRERTELEDSLGAINRLEGDLRDAEDLIEMGEAEGDQSIVNEAEDSIRALQAEAARRQIESLLSGEADQNLSLIHI